ncbi:MAG: glycosyltransferase family 4 protein [Desulfobulbaceae bacterium]|nr:glycosyltransferase family 4 protein [Desulfobulbaceae bacterium]
MRIAYIFLPGRIDRLAQMGTKELPSEFFYGAIELRKKGFDIDIFEAVEQPRRSLPRYLAEVTLPKRYLPIKTYPSILDAVWILLPKLKAYDVIVATTTGIAFSLVFWKFCYRLNFSVIGIINAILNYQLNSVRVMLSKFLLQRMAIHLFGEGEVEPISLEYGMPRERLTVNYFGVDSTFWHNDSAKEGGQYLLAVGNDSMRDFALLIEVAKRIDKKVVLVTRRDISGEIPANMEIVKGAWHSQELSDLALREMYHKAFCIIVPLKESFQPSGQSVTLQAMACEKPVILTRTSGLWDRKYLRHNENILFVEPGNVDHIIDRLRELDSSTLKSEELGKNARKYVLEHARIDFFAERLERSITNSL